MNTNFIYYKRVNHLIMFKQMRFAGKLFQNNVFVKTNSMPSCITLHYGTTPHCIASSGCMFSQSGMFSRSCIVSQSCMFSRGDKCPYCNGYKVLKCSECWGYGRIYFGGKKEHLCNTCLGSGCYTCKFCGGSGINFTL